MKTLINLMVIFITITSIGFSNECDCEEPVEVWFKISNDINSKDYGKIIALDMSMGYAGIDGKYVYLFVRVKDSADGITIAFPIGYWETEKISEFDKELEKEFKDLEDYLKHNKGKGIEIKKDK